MLFDLLSALVDSWSLWNELAGSTRQGIKWRMDYLARSYAAGAYVPYLEVVRESAAAAGLAPELADEMARRWDELAPWPGSGAVIRELARSVPVGVVTNCSQKLGLRAAECVDAPFDAVVTAESVGCYKPCRRIYAAGIEALGVPPQDVLFVAGSPGDVRGASAAGMTVVWHNRTALGAEAAPLAAAVVPDLQALRAKAGLVTCAA